MSLVEIRLVGLPVEIHRASSQHFAEVTREFAHLADDEASRAHAPARLIFLHRQLQERFAPFTQGTQNELEEAMARGDTTIDLLYEVPVEVGDAVRDLGALLDEVDEYCEAGQYLLALKTPPRALAYRRWFLEEFTAQASGRQPIPWADSPYRDQADT